MLYESVKASDTNLELKVLGAPYGVDRVGHEFTAQTDLGDLPTVPVIHYHGWGANDGARIGWAHKAERDAHGQWYRVVLDSTNAVAQKIYDDAKRGLVRASSDAISHLVRPADALKGFRGKIERWVIGALSLMDADTYDRAINPRAIALPAVRAMFADMLADEPDQSSVKAGATFAKRNRERLAQIQALLDEMSGEFPQEDTGAINVEPITVTGVKSMENQIPNPELSEALKFIADLKIERERARTTEEATKAQAALEAQMTKIMEAKLKEIDAQALKANRPSMFTAPIEAAKADKDQAYIDAFLRHIRTGDASAVKAAMNETTAGQGGYLVPIKYSNEIVKPLTEGSLLRLAGARVITVAGTNSFKIPSLTNTVRAAKIAEGVAFDEVEPTIGEMTFTPFKYTRLSLVSDELLSDSRIDVVNQVLMPDVANAFILAENDDFTVGDGSGDPSGVTVGASAGVTAASATVITADELIDLYHSLGYQYRPNAKWMMSDTALKQVRKLKDTTNQYLWSPGLAGGQPETLLGKPVIINNNMAAPATGVKAVLFGDFSYYYIADFGQLEYVRLNELYAATGQVGFRWFKRYDAHLMLTAAVKKLTMA